MVKLTVSGSKSIIFFPLELLNELKKKTKEIKDILEDIKFEFSDNQWKGYEFNDDLPICYGQMILKDEYGFWSIT